MTRLPLATVVALLAAAAQAEITIDDPYARSSNARAGAAFMTILNEGGPDDRLIGAHFDGAVRTELHTHIDEDGVMRMVHVEEGFAVPSGSDFSLQRGGPHVMFMGLTEPFKEGETLSVTLTFENAGEIIVEVPVDNARMPAAHGGNDDPGDPASD